MLATRMTVALLIAVAGFDSSAPAAHPPLPRAMAFPTAPAGGDAGIVLANPTDTPVSAVVGAANPGGVPLTDALEATVPGHERVALFPPDLPAGAASTHVAAVVRLGQAIVVRDASRAVLDAQLASDESTTTLDFPVASGTAASTAITVLNAGVQETDLGVVALARDGSMLATRTLSALPAGATASLAAADAFVPAVLEALATVRVIADQPLVGSAIAGGTDVALATAPAHAGTMLGVPVFAQDGGMVLDTVVQVFNPGASAVVVSLVGFDRGGTAVSSQESIPPLGSLVLSGPWPADATWLRITSDEPVVAQATVFSRAGGIATIPATAEEHGGLVHALDGTDDGTILIAVPVLDGRIDVVPAAEGSWRVFARPPATSELTADAGIGPALAGDACQPYAPIDIGETKSGTLAVGDCGSVLGANYFADRYSFTGTAGQQIVVTATGSEGLGLYLALIRDSDGFVLANGGFGSPVARIPGSTSFALPSTGTFLIEVTAFPAGATGSYQVTLGSPTTPFAAAGRVTVGTPGPGLANVTMTFSRVTGSGALPAPVTTDTAGYWFQTGFAPGTTYRVTPSRASYDFRLPRQDFTQSTALDFTAAFIECSAFDVVPIALGETKSGTLGAGDCRSPILGTTYYADRYGFSGTVGQQIVVTVVGTNGFLPNLLLVRENDRASYGGAIGHPVVRLPASGSFSLPHTGTFFIEVSSVQSGATAAYQVTLGSPTTPFPMSGRVTLGTSGPGFANATMTFTRVAGGGAIPAPVVTDGAGYWYQTGFEPGTTYRVTPSSATWYFNLPRRDFTQAAALDFTATFIECNAFDVIPIAVGETRSGTLAAGDCRSPIHGPSYFADRYSFSGTAGQQVIVTAVGAKGLAPNLVLIRDYDGGYYGGAIGAAVVRLPSTGSFGLPNTGAFIIEISSVQPNAKGGYQLTLGAPSTPFPATGRVTVNGGGVANAVLSFTRVTGGGALPSAVTTDADGYWFQTGFEHGTTYRVAASLAPYVFLPASRDFAQAAALDFSTTVATTTTTSSSTTSSTSTSTTSSSSPPTTTPTTSSTTSSSSTSSSTTSSRPTSTSTSTSSSTSSTIRPSTSTTISSTSSSSSSSRPSTTTSSSSSSTTSTTRASTSTTTSSTSSSTSSSRPSTTTTSSTTTTTLGSCGPDPFDSIACRIEALADRVVRDVRPSAFRTNLLDTLEQGALPNVRQAQGAASSGDPRQARLALENAERDLSKFVQRLNGRRGRRLVPRAVAVPLAAEARAIRAAIRTLAGGL